MGWIRRLTVSIITISDIRKVGVPDGTRCLTLAFHFVKNPIIWILNHKGIDNLKVILKWEVGANV